MSTEQTSSCVSCRRRKVKCDRLQPCSNCSKAQVICVPSVSLPPRRRKAQPLSENELHRRLRRYETLLKSYAARIAELESQGNTNGAGVVSANPESAFSVHNLWLSLSDDILEEVSTESEEFPVQGLSTDSPETIPEDIKLGLSFGLYSSTESLAYLHPPPVQIFKLWQIFLDNVHPLTKIIHAPTLQARILENSLDVTQAPRALEALMFAIYFCAVTSLEEKECESDFNETRNSLRSRFHGATMAALMRANLFNTSDVVLLQAAILFIVAISGSCDPGELWIILGTVVRIAQRLSLPEKAISSTIPVLDAEMSRRICWQISLLDARGAEIYGMGNSGIIKSGLTSLPLNVNDNDICKNTTAQPRGQSGATEMIFLLLKYEGANFVRESEAMAPYGGSWVTLSSPEVPIEEKNSVIKVLECLLEEKYLRYCDPTIPIHQLGLIRTRLVLNRMRLTTRHPRRRLASESQISPEEKSEIVNLCLEILADDDLLHTTPELKKYLWHISCHSHIDAIVYLLGELRESRIPEWEDIAWLRITSVFEHHPEMISYPHDHLTKAVSILALQSWGIREQKANSASHPPAFITRLRQEFVFDTHHSSAEGSHVDMSPPVGEDEGTANIPVSDLIENSLDSPFMPEYPATDSLAAIDWDYWNSLLGEASNRV